MAHAQTKDMHKDLEITVSALKSGKDDWAKTGTAERIQVLSEIKDHLMTVAEDWALAAARHKQIPDGSSLVGEEWVSGPYPVMAACNGLIETLSKMEGKAFLDSIPLRKLPNGQTCATVVPHTIWDRLLFSGIKAEIWMQKGVDASNIARNTAGAYDVPASKRVGKVSLILGAGNIAAIPPLDCFQKLFLENQVVILKMNPVNEYLVEYLNIALKPLIERNALRITRGGTDVGEYLCTHPDIEEIHITGAKTSHDAIVWGAGEEGAKNKAAGTPRNTRRITSELGGVGPTIVVPGPWSKADLRFQAEHVATQKLHNSGFNCIACQMLILPEGWAKTKPFLEQLKKVVATAPSRPLYYPGANERVAAFADHGKTVDRLSRNGADPVVVVPFNKAKDDWFEKTEVFGPALSTHMLASETDPEAYLRAAISYVNENLHGTLGANIIIHPSTLRKIGKKKFDQIITDLEYGCIAVNAWTGLGFLTVQTPWGGFPGHTPEDVGSGIGTVHNTYMFDKPERTVVYAPFRPFPRTLLSGGMTLLPKPPWFITNKRAAQLGRRLTAFQYKPGWLKIPGIFINALRG
jgi:aldehyde dehydrogenase (NAD(P)+)